MSGTFGFVCGGGGVLAACELGALHALRDWGITPGVVVGASAGGIIAGSLGAGVTLVALTATLRIVCARPARYGLGDLRAAEGVFRESATPGLWSLRPALDDVLLHGKARTVGDWSPGYGVTVTDLTTARTFYVSPSHRWGAVDTAEALQATSAFPGLFEGIRDSQSGLYADGGIIDNVPCDLAVRLGADRLVSVSFDGLAAVPPRLGPLAVLYRSVQVAIQAAQRPEPKVPTLTLRPKMPAAAWLLSFALFDELLEAGYAAAVARRAEIEKLAAGEAAA